jgi:hypothetical protein
VGLGDLVMGCWCAVAHSHIVTHCFSIWEWCEGPLRKALEEVGVAVGCCGRMVCENVWPFWGGGRWCARSYSSLLCSSTGLNNGKLSATSTSTSCASFCCCSSSRRGIHQAWCDHRYNRRKCEAWHGVESCHACSPAKWRCWHMAGRVR